MISTDILRLPDDDAAAHILSIAREVEGRRVSRILTATDTTMFLAAIRKYPMSRIRVFANRGEYARLSEKVPPKMTILEYTPPDGYGGAQAAVTECDARRPHAKGPWIEVDGRREA